MPQFQNHGNMRTRNADGKRSGKSPLQVIQREARHMGSEAICRACTHWTQPDTTSDRVGLGRCAKTGVQQASYGICLKWEKNP